MPTLYENQQWKVTEYGLESVRPSGEYNIAAERLLEVRDKGGRHYTWPVHMAEKPWVKIDSFIEAFLKAIELHAGRYEGSVDPAIMSESLARARERASSRHV